MDEQTLKEMFRSTARHDTGPKQDCPDDGVLAAALDGALEPGQRARFEAHVADCDHCIARLGRIGRLKNAGGDDRIPDITMARAKRLVRSSSLIRHAPRWVAAAAVVLVVLFTAVRFEQQPGVRESRLPPAPEIRNLDHDAYRPAVLFPAEETSIDARNTLFRWSAVPGSLHYNVRIVSADGRMLWQERVEDTHWRLPPGLALSGGEEYYFRVDAYLTEAKSVSSPHVLFRVEDGD